MGITTPRGDRYVALGIPGGKTMLAFVNTDGSVWNGPIFRGSWGIPMITYRDAGGLSLDGRTARAAEHGRRAVDELPRARLRTATASRTGSRSTARIRSTRFRPTRRGSISSTASTRASTCRATS